MIPAYRPDGRLLTLLDALAAGGARAVVVVDDGSGHQFADLFGQVRSHGADVLRHDRNQGKGAALRTAFAHVVRHHPGVGVVTADADGQHTADDILAVAHALTTGTDDLVLGVRDLTGAGVPARSRLGNTIAARAFRALTGIALDDTQTGLRGFNPEMLPALGQVRGDRFDYEFRVLLRASAWGVHIGQVPIATVYLDHNASSHLRPGRDSLSVIGPLLAFSLSGLAAFGIDTAALLALVRPAARRPSPCTSTTDGRTAPRERRMFGRGTRHPGQTSRVTSTPVRSACREGGRCAHVRPVDERHLRRPSPAAGRRCVGTCLRAVSGGSRAWRPGGQGPTVRTARR